MALPLDNKSELTVVTLAPPREQARRYTIHSRYLVDRVPRPDSGTSSGLPNVRRVPARERHNSFPSLHQVGDPGRVDLIEGLSH